MCAGFGCEHALLHIGIWQLKTFITLLNGVPVQFTRFFLNFIHSNSKNSNLISFCYRICTLWWVVIWWFLATAISDKWQRKVLWKCPIARTVWSGMCCHWSCKRMLAWWLPAYKNQSTIMVLALPFWSWICLFMYASLIYSLLFPSQITTVRFAGRKGYSIAYQIIFYFMTIISRIDFRCS